ncbi:type III-B CRISPR module RAMP protein Cmr4 [Natronosporangium hydrolyticum]|uniref:Type III-B CRISPR module RAMP protein Cmr4 n=1 Tax=Natronosporangium hydrolyticum TaxID=2811111 RepID=A0A895YGR4_9ACTN|nr:type III-B CRISPR module RAMP protein Cmr4 [Natronosporangium hydrolyticum]QSB16751.1 type III-B CRISPR module RAMP protein Cmr4 [Natronosporangium hydrolyticum]
MTELLLYLYAESPVHAGAADSLGVLDLPVQREATTRYPVIWGQSLKGALRQVAQDAGLEDLVVPVFGGSSEDGETELSAGRLTVGDAQLVAMPVPTLQRTFAWATSELALFRLVRKYARLGVTGLPQPPRLAPEAGAAASEAWIGSGRATRSEVLGPCLVELGIAPDPQLRRWAAQLATDVLGDAGSQASAPLAPLGGKLRDDLLAVGSDVMPMLLAECTEFVARVQLKEGKTVEHGPFHSEYLPTESILAASLTLRPMPAEGSLKTEDVIEFLLDLLHNKLIQVGGDETIGKGLVWARLLRADDVRAVAPEIADESTGVGQ